MGGAESVFFFQENPMPLIPWANPEGVDRGPDPLPEKSPTYSVS